MRTTFSLESKPTQTSQTVTLVSPTEDFTTTTLIEIPPTSSFSSNVSTTLPPPSTLPTPQPHDAVTHFLPPRFLLWSVVKLLLNGGICQSAMAAPGVSVHSIIAVHRASSISTSTTVLPWCLVSGPGCGQHVSTNRRSGVCTVYISRRKWSGGLQ
ncbi:hypothetical protein GWK47_008788 [Chionoecetes opilio]|uniref:Uncharacterized protein n=1 Tax=Chionoecetes opilio TaxID=41210 RepID=A0A8J4Y3H4_CHIOP|nr:hypothetical protein GWK47_008788 [Chionoecetes opilio]